MFLFSSNFIKQVYEEHFLPDNSELAFSVQDYISAILNKKITDEIYTKILSYIFLEMNNFDINPDRFHTLYKEKMLEEELSDIFLEFDNFLNENNFFTLNKAVLLLKNNKHYHHNNIKISKFDSFLPIEKTILDLLNPTTCNFDIDKNKLAVYNNNAFFTYLDHKLLGENVYYWGNLSGLPKDILLLKFLFFYFDVLSKINEFFDKSFSKKITNLKQKLENLKKIEVIEKKHILNFIYSLMEFTGNKITTQLINLIAKFIVFIDLYNNLFKLSGALFYNLLKDFIADFSMNSFQNPKGNEWIIFTSSNIVNRFPIVIKEELETNKKLPITKSEEINIKLNSTFSFPATWISKDICVTKFLFSKFLKIENIDFIDWKLYDNVEYGILYHNILEEYNLALKNKLINSLEDRTNFIKEKVNNLEEGFDKKEILEDLLKVIYWDFNNKIKILEVEKKFEKKIGNLILKSRIDRLIEKDGKVILQDFKLNKPSSITPYKFQIHVYKMLINDNYKVDNYQLLFLKEANTTDFIADIEIENKLLDKINNYIDELISYTEKTIKIANFTIKDEKKLSMDSCFKCEYFKICPFIELK